MAGKLNVYDIGQGGVNTSKSPVHLDTTELTKGQNAILNTAGVEGGLLKRGGIPRLNSSAMQGKINGAIHVPIAEEGAKTQTLYVPLEVTSGSNTFRTSTDGSTWAFATAPLKVAQRDKRNGGGMATTQVMQGMASLDGRLYYANDAYTQFNAAGHQPPPLRVWDGTNDEPFATVPYSPSEGDTTNAFFISEIMAANKRIYFVSNDGGSSTNDPARVFEADPATGLITQIGPEVGGGATGFGVSSHLIWFNNRLWIGDARGGTTQGTIHSIRPKLDTAWVLEDTITSKNASSFAVFEGLLYCGTNSTANAPTTRVRSSLGAWSNSDTGGLTGTETYVTGPMIVFNSKLYAIVTSTAGTNGTVIVREFDGSSWATDENLTSSFPGGVGGILQVPKQMVIFKDELYLVFAELGGGGTPGDPSGAVLKRTTGGTWSNEDDVSSTGWIGVVTA